MSDPSSRTTFLDRSFSEDAPVIEKDIPEEETTSFALDALAGIFKSNPKKQPKQLAEIDNEAAILMVVGEKSGEVRYITNKFFLTGLQESKTEKVQILETFGEPHVSFFGERAKTYQGTGFLLEAKSSNFVFPNKYRWASGFQKFYDDVLRGSQLVKNNNIAILDVGNNMISGYFLNLIMSSNAADGYKKQFSFNFLVKDHRLRMANELDVFYSLYSQVDLNSRAAFMGYESKLKEIGEQLLKKQLELDESKEPDQRRQLTNQYRLLREDRDLLIEGIKTLYLGSINQELEG